MKAVIFIFVLFSLPGLVLAQAPPNSYPKIPYPPPDPRVIQLEITLNQLNQAQQSVYQQFQMVQELRRNETQGNLPQAVLNPYPAQAPYSMGGMTSNPPLNYDDLVRLQREQQERVQQYTRNLNELYARYSELEEQKRAVLSQLMELTKGQQ
ncbi:hypothetical protein [Nitrosovibrio tenuis]|uniref:Uncharacterized protein n=1 Tax=Nitrosovibrio tenuis TaxID=1233 RepID=A0A1H7NRX7_9PROT|nr:hypothetical protein [Nitrosovibrio tenuis]SEL26350.1 hypothetical protein SAMN05216387_107120 [Nitrosovibrio tenuis]